MEVHFWGIDNLGLGTWLLGTWLWGICDWEWGINKFIFYRLSFYCAQVFCLIQPRLTKINMSVGLEKIWGCDRMTG
ncbi:hypothetical protein QT986_27765 [Microcoleus sp. herbarium14]